MTEQTTLTCCPNCDTRFRVTAEQLRVAGGKVRCGNCMNIFNALQHRVDKPTAPRPASAVPTSPAIPAGTATESPAAQARKPLFDDDELVFQDDPESDASDPGYAGSGKLFDQDELSDSFRALDEKFPDQIFPDDEPPETVDESWAESMLDDDPRPAPRAKTATVRPRPPEQEVSPALSLVETQEHKAYTGPMSPAPTPTMRHHGMEPPLHARDDHRPSRARPPFDNLRAAPISVDTPSGGWLSNLAWGLLTLLLLALVIWQVFWFQFERLARMEPLRPFYELTCPFVGCTLPVMSALDRIESRKLVVRDHPQQRRTLLVEATIINQASFAQPFPGIALSFSNLNQDVIAQRIFKPEEYLQGDAARLPLMEPDTPFTIALSLKDPGREAVNWSLKFMPPPAH